MYEINIEEIRKARAGDKDSMALLIEENSGLIWSIASRFKERGHPLEDIYQLGVVGFIKAIKNFDESYEVRLSTYVVPVIIGEIKRFLRDDGPVKVSRSIKELSFKINILQKEHLNKTGEEISLQELAKELDTSKEDIAMALDSYNPVTSIYNETGSDSESNVTVLDKISSGVDEATVLTDKMAVNQLISGLNSKDKEIIMLRYFKEKTQMQVAKMLGISQVQVSRIEKRILNSMRAKLRCV